MRLLGRILTVDDDKSQLWLLGEYLLSSMNCAVVGVGSVNEAHRFINTNFGLRAKIRPSR